jgi:hypothetical protein
VSREYSLEEKKAARFKMLEKIYQETGGSENGFCDISLIGEMLNYPTDLVEMTCEYLHGEGLIEYITIGGCVGITHYGIVQYEDAKRTPEKETKYFPPINIIYKNYNFNVKKMIKSQAQIGTTNSEQKMTNNENYDDLKLWLKNLEDLLIREREKEILEKLRDDIEFIRSNIATQNPSKKYIGAALDTIKNVLTGIASNAIFHELLQRLPSLLP